MVNKRHIIAIDFVLVVGTLLVIAGIVGYARPLVISPIDDLKTTDSSVLFVFDKADLILIDDNLEFSSPTRISAENNLVINLKPGVYYWKVEGTLSSEVRKLTIESEINLKLKDSGENYEVVNSGNTELNVDIYEQEKFTGNVVLDIDGEKEVSGTKFIGGQSE